MLQRYFSRRALGAVLLVLLTLPLAAWADGPRRLVIFGDSLSDPGNGFALTGTVSLPPFDPIPSYPYAIGGLHLSNGPTWVEQLVSKRIVKLQSAKPAFKVPGLFTNYAVGATRARPDSGTIPEEDLSFQTERFLADYGGVARPDATYVIFVGGNDLRDALAAALVDPTFVTSQQILTAAVTGVAANLQVLYAAGARRFVVVNGPDLAIVPAVAQLGPAAQAGGTLLATLYNQSLAGALAQLSALPGSTINTVDIFTALRQVVANPADYGLTNVTTPCLTFSVTIGFRCARPDEYLFWDAIHPTRAGQRILGMIMAPALL
jgi:outer membrane lipase/esterase